MDEFDPYFAPGAAVSPAKLPVKDGEGKGVWRDGDVLVMSKYARLPSRCVKCNASATDRLTLKLSWFPQALWLLWLLPVPGLILFLVLMAIERRTARVEVPVCEGHRAARSRAILISWLVLLLGFGLIALGSLMYSFDLPILQAIAEASRDVLVVVGASTLLFGAAYALSSARLVSVRKIDKKYAWIGKVGEPYLATLAQLPTYDD